MSATPTTKIRCFFDSKSRYCSGNEMANILTFGAFGLSSNPALHCGDDFAYGGGVDLLYICQRRQALLIPQHESFSNQGTPNLATILEASIELFEPVTK